VRQFGFNSDRRGRTAEYNNEQSEDHDDRGNSHADQHLDDQGPHGEILTIRTSIFPTWSLTPAAITGVRGYGFLGLGDKEPTRKPNELPGQQPSFEQDVVWAGVVTSG
jgi:hypothetical protein